MSWCCNVSSSIIVSCLTGVSPGCRSLSWQHVDEDSRQFAGGYQEALEITTHLQAANQPGNLQNHQRRVP
jgi:hypothetical protein